MSRLHTHHACNSIGEWVHSPHRTALAGSGATICPYSKGNLALLHQIATNAGVNSFQMVGWVVAPYTDDISQSGVPKRWSYSPECYIYVASTPPVVPHLLECGRGRKNVTSEWFDYWDGSFQIRMVARRTGLGRHLYQRLCISSVRRRWWRFEKTQTFC